MIHILTVHWNSPRWIQIQGAYLRKYLQLPFRIGAFINNISPEWESHFDWVINEVLDDHAVKLNLLADFVLLSSSDDDDILIFMGGDAFPVAPMGFLLGKLNDYPLVAIKRSELHCDPQPHPSICATTVRFWRKIRGSWENGKTWLDTVNGERVSDTGGKLYQLLEDTGSKWLPLLRTNEHNLHCLWFGVYGGIVYRHGAGFREPFSRADHSRLSFFMKVWRILNRKLDSLSTFCQIHWNRIAIKKVSDAHLSTTEFSIFSAKKRVRFFRGNKI